MISGIKGLLRRAAIVDRNRFKGFLRDVSGIVHVGAHTGQERFVYSQYRLAVLWIEPLPAIYEALTRNISELPDQRAVQALVTDEDHRDYDFHVTSNAGASSSIYRLDKHKDIWPEVTATETITLRSRTLASLLADESNPGRYDALALDTQGSELLVLKGAEPILDGFRYIKAEAADFHAYEGACRLSEIESYLAIFGFAEIARRQIAAHPEGGAYYDVVFRRGD